MKYEPIRILKLNYLQGPNIWTYKAVIEAWLDIGMLEDHPSHTIPGFVDRLVAWLPSLEEHHCSPGYRGGFIERLRTGTWPGHIVEHVALELQSLASVPTGFGKARETRQRGVYKVVFRARQREVGELALDLAIALVMAAMNDEPFDTTDAVQQLKDKIDRYGFGPSTQCIVDAAQDRDVPFIRLSDGNLVQLGYGARQTRIWTAETRKTSAISAYIASEKDLAKQILKGCGVPVPEGRPVDSADDAWEAAQDIGLPVAVKPGDANHGRGVSLDLNDEAQVREAWKVAREVSRDVIVERQIPGEEHRLLVVGGKLVAASRGQSARVIGDGVSTINQLVDKQLNSDPRRSWNQGDPLTTLVPAEDGRILLELTRQGLTPESVPAAGREVMIQRSGNLSFDCTDEVHPDVAEVAGIAARAVGLDVCGIDLVARDISRPLEEQGGAVVEVNSGPGLLMHLRPMHGQPRPVGKAIVDHLLPPDAPVSIPIIGVTGQRGTTLAAGLLAWLLHLQNRRVGLTCQSGWFMNRRRFSSKPANNFESARRLLINPFLDAAVIENPASQILSDGLAYERCHVGMVLDAGWSPELAEHDILDEPDDTYKVYRTQIDVVLAEGAAVLNADDAVALEMAGLCDGEVLLFAASRSEAIAAHRDAVHRAVWLADGQIMLGSSEGERSLCALADLPIVTSDSSTRSALAAIAAAWHLSIPLDLVVAGIRTFQTDMPQQVAGMSQFFIPQAFA